MGNSQTAGQQQASSALEKETNCDMSDQEIREALCSAIPGWRPGDPSGLSGVVHWTKDGVEMLSDPIRDLNAMHEAEKTIFHTPHWDRYYHLLRDLTTSIIHAEPAAKAEAFLRTIGKWKEAA